MKRLAGLLLLGVGTARLMGGAPELDATASPPVAAAAAPQATLTYDGQTFELASSTATATVATDEYVMPGEKIGTWTQLLTVQRLTMAAPVAADEFATFFKNRVAADGATLEVLKAGRAASVFAVRFPKSERNEEQVMVCLAFVDAAKPVLLNIVQFALKPERAPLGVVESRIRSWRDKFVRQAASLGKLP